MKTFAMYVLVLAIICMSMPALASCGACGSGSKTEAPMEQVGDPMTDDSPEESLDDVIGAGTSGRLAAQGTVGYSDNTGLMNVVPSDSEGDIEN